jgi:hypothetical protein
LNRAEEARTPSCPSAATPTVIAPEIGFSLIPATKAAVCVPCRADANGAGLASKARVPNIDIIVTGREIHAGCIHQCNVVVAGCVVKERIKAAAMLFVPVVL